MAEAIARRPGAAEDRQAAGHQRELADARARVDAALAVHAESVVAAVELLQTLQDHGLLDLVRGLVTRRDELLEVLAGLLAKPGYAGAVRSVFALLQGLGHMDAEILADVLPAAVVGLREARAAAAGAETPGLFEWLALLRDPDVSTAVTAGFAFLKAMGSALRGGAGDHADA